MANHGITGTSLRRVAAHCYLLTQHDVCVIYYQYGSGELLAVLGSKLEDLVHAGPVAGVQATSVRCLPGLGLH